MKIAALILGMATVFCSSSIWSDSETDYQHLSQLIRKVDNNDASLNFSDFPIDNLYASTFFKPFKNVAITDIKITSNTADVLIFQGNVTVAQQTMVVEFAIMGDKYARIVDRPLVVPADVVAAQKVIDNLVNVRGLNRNPVMPLEKLHKKSAIQAVVGDFLPPALQTQSEIAKKNAQREEVIKSYFTTQKRLNAVSSRTNYALSERDKEALKSLDFSITIVAPTLNLAAFAKKVDYRLAESLEFLDVKDAAFIYSTRRYHHPRLKQEIERGVNLVGVIKTKYINHEPFASSIKLINKYTKLSGLDIFIVSGIITPDIIGSTFTIDIPGSVKIGKKIASNGLQLRVQVTNEKNRLLVSVIGKFAITVSDQSAPLIALGSINFTPTTIVTFTAEIPGTWKNPFGVPALELSDVVMEIGADFELVAASEGTIPITDLGGRAHLSFPSGRMEFALFMSLTENDRMLLYGDFLGSLSLKDLTHLSLRMHAEENRVAAKKMATIREKMVNLVPDFTLREARVFVSPVHQIVGNKEYHKGMSIKAYIDIWDDHIVFETKVGAKGLHALAYMPEFKLGPLQVKGSHFLSDADNTYSLASVSKLNASSGPIIYLNIDPRDEKTEFFVDALVEAEILGGISADTRIHLQKGGASFSLTERLGKVFLSDLDFTTYNHVDSRDLELRGSFTSQALQLLEHKLRAKALVSKSDVLAKMLSRVEDVFDFKKVTFAADVSGMEKNNLIVNAQFSLMNKHFELSNLTLDFDDVKGLVSEIYAQILEEVVRYRE